MSSDLFSKQATTYSRFRPTYPDALYEAILSHCANRELAWDCATGNGQAATGLSPYFKRVVATDLSQSQIENAISKSNIEYRVLRAEEKVPLPDESVDLVTVAQAIHWFDLDTFYSEVKRVLKPKGIFATWAYSFHSPLSKEIDEVLQEFYFVTLGNYWQPNNRLIWDA
jgi:ubiquinone/menaquinone biosynthesis C-methylase UbiE